jgi:membrane protease YdiL (CAAX protease family)
MRPSHMAAFPLSIGASFGGLGIATLLITLFEMLASNSPFWQSMLGNYEQSNAGLQDANLLLLTLGVVILIPFAEELLFRGIVTEEFRRVAPDWLAIVLGGIIFALVHGNLVQILYVLPLGLLLGAAYIWTNSIWSPILIHVVFNFFGSVFGLLIGENETVRTIYTIFLMVMIPVGILCTVIMYRMFRKNKGKKEPAGEVIGK